MLTTLIEKSRTLKLRAKIDWMTWISGSIFKVSFPVHTPILEERIGDLFSVENRRETITILGNCNSFKTQVLEVAVLWESSLLSPALLVFLLKSLWFCGVFFVCVFISVVLLPWCQVIFRSNLVFHILSLILDYHYHNKLFWGKVNFIFLALSFSSQLSNCSVFVCFLAPYNFLGTFLRWYINL